MDEHITAPPPRGRLRRGVGAVTQLMALLSILCIVVMLAATVADVVKRGLGGGSVQGVTELGEVMMVAIVFLSLGYAESRGAHVSMTLVVRRLRPRVATVLNTAALLLVAVVVAWLFVVTAERAVESFQTSEYRFGLVQIPIWPARIAIAVGLASYLLELLFRVSDNVRTAGR